MRWIPFVRPVIGAATLLLAGCAHVPTDQTLTLHSTTSPLNRQAASGPAVPDADFLDVAHAKAQIAQPAVLILNKPAATAPKSGMDGMKGMNMNSMPGMNMKGGKQ